MWIYRIVSRNRPSLSFVSRSVSVSPFSFRDPRPFRSGIRCFLIILPSRTIVHTRQSATETNPAALSARDIWQYPNERPAGGDNVPWKGTRGKKRKDRRDELKRDGGRDFIAARARREHAEHKTVAQIPHPIAIAT